MSTPEARDEVDEARDPGDPPAAGAEYPYCAPELASSRLPQGASFGHVALASLLARDDRRGGRFISEDDRADCRRRTPGLLDAFEDAHGPIRRSYFARNAFAAAAVTDDDELDMVRGTDESLRHPRYVELLMRCQSMSYLAWHRLSKWDRRLCMDMIFSVAVEVLRRMDRAAQVGRRSPSAHNGNGTPEPARPSGRELELLSKELDSAEDFMLRCAGRRAQIRYTKGMLVGLLPALALIGTAVGAMQGLGVSRTFTSEVALVLGAGAIGAVVSVLVRMTVGRFNMNLPTLDHDMRRTDLTLIGMLRPLVGAVFALVVYTFIQAALVPVEPNGDAPDVFLYLAAGFLAGFSERFAQDMFARSGQGLLGAVGDSPTSGPAAGLSPPPGRVASA